MVKMNRREIYNESDLYIESIKTRFARNRHKLSQVDFQDFSDFAQNAYSSTLSQSISKNHNISIWLTMVRGQLTLKDLAFWLRNRCKISTMSEKSDFSTKVSDIIPFAKLLIQNRINFCHFYPDFGFSAP